MGYLKRSLLPDGRLGRFYELETNKPLYVSRRGKQYTVTDEAGNAASNYGWKWESRLETLEAKHEAMIGGSLPGSPGVEASEARHIVDSMDARGRWISTCQGERLVGQAERIISHRKPSATTWKR